MRERFDRVFKIVVPYFRRKRLRELDNTVCLPNMQMRYRIERDGICVDYVAAVLSDVF